MLGDMKLREKSSVFINSIPFTAAGHEASTDLNTGKRLQFS